MKKVIKLTESELTKLIKKIVNEQIKPAPSDSMINPLDGAKLMSIKKDKNPKLSVAVIGPKPVGQKPKIEFKACVSSFNDCFETPDFLRPGEYTSSDMSNPYLTSNFFFHSKDGTKYLCTFKEFCKRV